MTEVKILFNGFGNVSRTFCQLLMKKQAEGTPFLTSCGKKLKVVGAVDSSGGVYSAEGLDLKLLIEHKMAEGQLTGCSKTISCTEHDDILEIIENRSFDVLVEASPFVEKTGGLGLAAVMKALEQGKNVVLANKAPLVLAFDKVMKTKEKHGCSIAFSATVCGGLPVVNVGSRDLPGAVITKAEGVLNSTSNFILSEIERGSTTKIAIAEAQRRGIAETNPRLDVSGLDAANKLVIIANSVLKVKPAVSLESVNIQGIEEVTLDKMKEAKSRGKVIRLIASAVLDEATNEYKFEVAPKEVEENSFMGKTENTDKCCVFYSDLYETTFLKTNERGVYPTSAAVIRDIINMF